MKVVGLYLVRNEVDLIELNLLHHFATAIDEAIIIDNGSTDGTLERLALLTQLMPIHVASEPGPYDQSARVTRMARLAAQKGAEWVLPIDADEFWIGTDATLRSILRDVPPDVSALQAEVVNFVQRREALIAGRKSLLSMTMRPPSQVGPIDLCEDLVESRQIGFVEMMYPPKWVSRAYPNMVITNGNHSVEGIPDNTQLTDAIQCLHAPLRARSLLTGKLDQGRRVDEEGRKDYWHVRRWWRLSREGAIEAEWAANSFENGSITVGNQIRPLVEDTRLRDAVAEFIPEDARDEPDPLEVLDPAIAAYLVALDTVPGWFSPLDYRLFTVFDRVQREHSVRGDLFEIGVYCGKSAILLGHLARLSGEHLVVCDLFENVSSLDDENLAEFRTWYSDFCQRDFVDQYLRFHAQLPTILVSASTGIDAEALADTCRFVHIDGSHTYDIVREDIRTAERILGPGGIVAFDDISTAHNPGSALAVWEEVLSGRFVPLCLTEAKLSGSWDPQAIDWRLDLDEWVARNPDVECEMHTLSGWAVRRVYAVPRPPIAADSVTRVPSLDELEGADCSAPLEMTVDTDGREPAPPPRYQVARSFAHLVAPPIAVSFYRRLKALRTWFGRS